MTKKILAVLMTLALILSFAACGAKDTGETTEMTTQDIFADATDEATEEAADTTSEEASEEATEATSEEASEEATEATSEATTEKATEATSEETTEESTTEAAKAPQTKEEIVEYFNKSVNSVKTDAKTVVSPYSKISLAGPTTLPSALNGVLRILGGADKFLGDQLAKNSRTESETYSTKAEIQAKFPVEGETYASKLTPADVKSATCVEKDGKYMITIVTVADGKSSTVKHGQGHAPKAFNVVLPGVVNDNIPGAAASLVGTATMDYPSSTVKVVVDKETGHVITAQYDLYWTINFDKVGAVLPFLTSTLYEVKY